MKQHRNCCPEGAGQRGPPACWCLIWTVPTIWACSYHSFRHGDQVSHRLVDAPHPIGSFTLDNYQQVLGGKE